MKFFFKNFMETWIDCAESSIETLETLDFEKMEAQDVKEYILEQANTIKDSLKNIKDSLNKE